MFHFKLFCLKTKQNLQVVIARRNDEANQHTYKLVCFGQSPRNDEHKFSLTKRY